MEALKINTATVKVNKVKGKSKSKAQPKRRGKVTTADKARAGAFFTLAACGLAVSLPHLAGEVALLTGSAGFACWLIALTIDLGMACCKVHLACSGPARLVCWTVLGTCTAVSMVLNCHAFFEHATAGFGQAAAIGFGLFLPAFILALSYMGSEILLGHKD